MHALPPHAQYNEYDLYFRMLGIDGAFTDSVDILAGYLKAEEIAGNAWDTNSRVRWNARPTTCKRPALARKA